MSTFKPVPRSCRSAHCSRFAATPSRLTRMPRAGLQSATFDPQAMRGSLRTFGNGGFFSITGFYWNKTLRTYRAFVTDPRHAVVLRYERRMVVVSPGDPEAFVRELAETN